MSRSLINQLTARGLARGHRIACRIQGSAMKTGPQGMQQRRTQCTLAPHSLSCADGSPVLCSSCLSSQVSNRRLLLRFLPTSRCAAARVASITVQKWPNTMRKRMARLSERSFPLARTAMLLSSLPQRRHSHSLGTLLRTLCPNSTSYPAKLFAPRSFRSISRSASAGLLRRLAKG